MSDPKAPSPLAAALAAAQSEIRDPARDKKGQVRGRSDYRYAGLDDLLKAVRPALSKHGIAIVQLVELVDGKPCLLSQLRHAEGEVIASVWPLAWPNDPQQRGSELSYARRYTLEALVGVAATEDDDGSSASESVREGAQDSRNNRAPTTSSTPRTEIRPAWDEAAWTSALAAVGLTLDEAGWWGLTKAGLRKHPRDLSPEDQADALSFFTSPKGVEQVRADVKAVRDDLQRAFFAKWSSEFPDPRKKDGISDEDRAEAVSANESRRKLVMLMWYGVESVKEVPIRAAVRGKRKIEWLREVSPPDFRKAVDEALEAAVAAGAGGA
jgi:ERF superfamily protein